MPYTHYIHVHAAKIQKLKDFLEEHPDSIDPHSPGFTGKAYLVYATVDLGEALRARGFECWVYKF